jgi:Uma2 family endonuclease
MSVAIAPQQERIPRAGQWTRSAYERLVQAGLFDGQHVELIAGHVITMSPMGSLHAAAVALVARALETVFEMGYFVRWQMPFAVGAWSEPEPDVAVIAGQIRDYVGAHPSQAALIVEVAETSLAYDRIEKASLYAMAGVPEYWVVNLVDGQVEIYRTPIPDSAQPHGYGYAEIVWRGVGEVIAPLAAAQAAILVDDLLP